MQKLKVDVNAKALIFDIDGTLADSMPIHYKAWKTTADRYGIDFPESLFYEWAGVPAPTIAQKLMKKEFIDMAARKMAEEKEDTYVEMIHLIQPLVPVVDLVKSYYGFLPITAGTGSPRKVAAMTLKVLGIANCFQAVVSYEDVENPKPAPDTFYRCAQLMNIEPQHCQVFEDGEPGLVAARSAGMIATDIRSFI